MHHMLTGDEEEPHLSYASATTPVQHDFWSLTAGHGWAVEAEEDPRTASGEVGYRSHDRYAWSSPASRKGGQTALRCSKCGCDRSRRRRGQRSSARSRIRICRPGGRVLLCSHILEGGTSASVMSCRESSRMRPWWWPQHTVMAVAVAVAVGLLAILGTRRLIGFSPGHAAIDAGCRGFG